MGHPSPLMALSPASVAAKMFRDASEGAPPRPRRSHRVFPGKIRGGDGQAWRRGVDSRSENHFSPARRRMPMYHRLQLLALLCIALGMSFPASAVPKKSLEAGAPRFREYVKVVERAYQRVGLTVTVTDRTGRTVQGLMRDDFRLLEDGVEVAIQDFGVEGDKSDRPLSVAVLLDLSQSMGGQVQRVREAAEALLAALRRGDEIMVAKFNHERTVLQPFTRDPKAPEVTLRDIGTAWGGTRLFRSIEQTLKDLRQRPGRKVILVVTDGLDNYVGPADGIYQSLYLRDLLHLCLRTQTVVYGIRPGMVAGWQPFERFVEETGGRLLYTGGDLERL